MLNDAEKLKIIKFINQTPLEYLSYEELKSSIKCKNDIMILSFLISYVDKEFKKDSIRLGLISKILDIILYLLEIGISISFEDKHIIENLSSAYNDYLNNNNKKEEEKITYYIEKLTEEISNYETSKDLEEKEESVSELKEKITNLKKKLEEYEKSIKDLQEKIKKSNENNDKKSKRINALTNELEQAKKEYEEILQKLKEATNKDKDYNQNVEDLKKEIKAAKDKIEALTQRVTTSSEKNRKLENKLIEAERRNDSLQNELEVMKSKINPLSQYNSKIIETIINILYKETLNIYEIQEKLEELGLKITEEDILKIIDVLKSKLSLNSNNLFVPIQEYGISTPRISKGNEFTINCESKTIEFMFIADFHIDFTNMRNIYLIYEHILKFCKDNHINYVFDLGDFFDFVKPSSILNCDNLKEIVNQMSELIKNLPRENDIYHALLGGNHDLDSAKYGIDWIDYFTKSRQDYFNLGYDYCQIEIAGKNHAIGNFYLSHPNNTIIEKDLLDRMQNTSRLIGKKFDFHFFGHHHSSFLDTKSQVCIVPSLTRDRVCPGAWHIIIQMDKTGIVDIEFRPLVFKNEFIPTSSILYRKKS